MRSSITCISVDQAVLGIDSVILYVPKNRSLKGRVEIMKQKFHKLIAVICFLGLGCVLILIASITLLERGPRLIPADAWTSMILLYFWGSLMILIWPRYWHYVFRRQEYEHAFLWNKVVFFLLTSNILILARIRLGISIQNWVDSLWLLAVFILTTKFFRDKEIRSRITSLTDKIIIGN